MGATSTDHGHPTARTADLSPAEAEALVRPGQGRQAQRRRRGAFPRPDADRDGPHESLRTGSSCRSTRAPAATTILGFSRPSAGTRDATSRVPTDYVSALKPLLDRFGNERDLTVILFTLDETAYSRELAPLAGHYPALKLGPPWWFFDSPEGMRRYREAVTETAGFYNTVGFNDDTRAFLSIPARHDVARRCDCAFLARLVAEHRLEEDEAFEVAQDLAYRLVKSAYKL